MDFSRPKVVVSKCLGFGNCRFDGSMISSQDIDQLKPYVDFMSLCPEMGIGLPSPRESLRLIQIQDEHHLVMTKCGDDKTEDMMRFAESAYDQISDFQPDGFLLKGGSPSCGIKEVRVYHSIGKVPCINRKAKGMFAGYMMDKFSDILFEDEGRMSNFNIREHFYTAIFSKADFRQIKTGKTMKALVHFHGKNKFLFMAYSHNQMSVLGRIVANHKKLSTEEVFREYESNLDKLLIRTPTQGQYINIMLHIFGYFSKDLSAKEKAYFLDALENYRSKHIPQSTVMAILWSWVIRFDDEYLLQQTVFEPFPKALIQVTDSGKGL